MKIRAIIKRPDEKHGHMTWISDRLENLQRTVDGYIEVVKISESVIIICNEEGKLIGLEDNFKAGDDVIKGTVIICGVKGEEFCDLPEWFTFEAWKRLLVVWGN